MTTINAHLINWIALQIVITASSRGPVSGCDGDLEVPPGSPILEHSSLVRATYLRLAETLTTFLTRLRSSADQGLARGAGDQHAQDIRTGGVEPH